MHLQLREKYQQILEEPQSQNDSYRQAHQQMREQRKRKILTETQDHLNRSRISVSKGQDPSLQIKEKLAQSLSNLKETQKQVQSLKQQSALHIQNQKLLEKEIDTLQATLRQVREEVAAGKTHQAQIKQDKQKIQRMYEQLSIDKELLTKQINFYQTEIERYRSKLNEKKTLFAKFEKDMKGSCDMQAQNSRLKADVSRLLKLIDSSCRFGKIRADLVQKHFLGTPHKESQYWQPSSLFGEVECFLKKRQLGYGNKQFTTALVKFIDSYCNKIGKDKEQNLRESLRKSSLRHHRSSSQEQPELPLHGSILRKISNYNYQPARTNYLKTFTSSRILDQKLSKSFSLPQHRPSEIGNILDEFTRLMDVLLRQKQVKRKKAMRIVEEMSRSVIEITQTQGKV